LTRRHRSVVGGDIDVTIVEDDEIGLLPQAAASVRDGSAPDGRFVEHGDDGPLFGREPHHRTPGFVDLRCAALTGGVLR